MLWVLRYHLVTWESTEIFLSKFAYFFQVSDNAIKWTLTKRFTLSTPLVCDGWTWIFDILSEMFSTSAIRNAYSSHKLPNTHFFEHFLLISHDFRIINGQKSMRVECCAVSVSYRQMICHCNNSRILSKHRC